MTTLRNSGPRFFPCFIAFWSLVHTLYIVISWLCATPSNCCVLICFHSCISCFDMLSNSTSAPEYTSLEMLEFGNFRESTKCKWQRRILWRRCHLFWKISLGLCPTANAVHRVCFSKVEGCMQGMAKGRLHTYSFHHFTIPRMQLGQLLWHSNNQKLSFPSTDFSGWSPTQYSHLSINQFYADRMFLLPWEMPSAAIQPFFMAHEPNLRNAALCHLNITLADGCPPRLILHA